MDDLYNQTQESIARQIQAHDYMHVVGVSILYYDHFLTLRPEIEHLWKRKKSHSAYWFFLNRYFAFLANLSVTILGFTTLPPESCRHYNLYRQILLIVNQVLVCVLLTLRIYALYNRSKPILAYMLISGAILAGVACYVMFGQESKVAEASGCHTGLEKISAIRLAGAWEALFVYDSILFSLTLWKTLKERRDRRITGINIALISLILRDGCMYFAIMALCNLANILTFYFGGPYFRGSLSTFASCFSVTMMSRLMLNLHQTADEGIYTMSSTINKTNTQFSLGGKYDTTTDQTTTTMTNRVELDTIWSTNNGNSFSAPEEEWGQAVYARPRDGSGDVDDEMIAMTPRRSSRSTSRVRERRSYSQSQMRMA